MEGCFTFQWAGGGGGGGGGGHQGGMGFGGGGGGGGGGGVHHGGIGFDGGEAVLKKIVGWGSSPPPMPTPTMRNPAYWWWLGVLRVPTVSHCWFF